jgi:hypothetical protein
MRQIACFIALFTLAVMSVAPLSAQGADKKVKGEVVMKVGKKLHLFHSGTADVKKEVCLNDVIPVYRETMAGGHSKTLEVGKVKVLSYSGEHYFEVEVVSGEIKVGDIAKKDTAYCLVQPLK